MEVAMRVVVPAGLVASMRAVIPRLTVSIDCVVVGGTTALQSKRATPTELQQMVTPDAGYALASVLVEPIPSNYGKITWNGVTLTVS